MFDRTKIEDGKKEREVFASPCKETTQPSAHPVEDDRLDDGAEERAGGSHYDSMSVAESCEIELEVMMLKIHLKEESKKLLKHLELLQFISFVKFSLLSSFMTKLLLIYYFQRYGVLYHAMKKWVTENTNTNTYAKYYIYLKLSISFGYYGGAVYTQNITIQHPSHLRFDRQEPIIINAEVQVEGHHYPDHGDVSEPFAVAPVARPLVIPSQVEPRYADLRRGLPRQNI